MIIIDKPFIETIGDKTYLKSYIIDEFTGTHDFCYYFTGTKYGNYFTCEVADAFVLALLLPALQSNQDILVKAPVSEKLYYNLKHTVIYLLAKAFKYKEIDIKVEKTIVLETNSTGVGTGCSLGVDSFATMLSHTSQDCPESYKLTHLTFFNVGSHGEKDFGKVRESYLKDLIVIKDFANEIKLPLVSAESNLSIFYSNYGFNFNQSHLIRNMSTVLSMQKLFKKYIYSSGFPVTWTHITDKDIAIMESILQPLLSTESTELIVGEAKLFRSEKTRLISEYELPRKHLYVCLKNLVINDKMNTVWFNHDTKFRNCGTCEKCLRTLITFDIIGKTNLYEDIFDIKKFNSLKKLYMAKIIGLKNKDFFCYDIYYFAKRNNYKISFLSRVLSVLYRYRIIDFYYFLKSKH